MANENKSEISLGAFTVDVIMKGKNNFDVYISHEGSSGASYSNVNSDRIGELLAGDIEAVAENYEDKFSN